MFVIVFNSWVETKNKIGRGKRIYPKPGDEKTQIPTMKWVFFLFRRITELVIEFDGKKYRKILKMDEETIKILKLMGEKYEKYYMWKIAESRICAPTYA